MVISSHSFAQNTVVTDIEKIFNQIDDPRTKLDTINKYMHKIYQYGYFEKAADWAKVGLKLAEQLNDSYKDSEMKILIARYHARSNEIEKALATVKDVMDKDDEYAKSQRAYLYGRYSYMSLQANKSSQALKYNYLSDSLYKIEDPWHRFKVRISRADIYGQQGLRQPAMQAAEEAYELFEPKTDTINHLWLLYRICQVASESRYPDKFTIYAEKYIEFSKDRKNKFHRGVFDMDVEPIKHLEDIEKVAANFKKSDYKRGYYLAAEKLSQLYENVGNYKKAYEYILQIEPDVKLHNFENSTLSFQESKYRIERKLGLKDAALNSVDELLKARDSFQQEQFQRQSFEFAAKYEAKEKEQEILILNKESELKDIRIQRSNNTKWLFGGGALALLLFSFYLAKNIRDKKKINGILEEKNEIINANLLEKETLLKEIHHRVKNNLQIISSLLRLQSRTIDDPETKEVFLEGQNRVQSMALIHQNLYKENNLKGVEVKSYIEKLCNNLLETYKISKDDIKLDLDIAPINLDVTTLIPLGLIINELFSNSLKYAFENVDAPTMGVRLFEKENKLHLSVYDNGQGVKDEMIEFLNNSQMRGNKNWGFGTRLIKTFAKKLEATIQASNSAGTEVDLIIDEYKTV